MENTKNLKEIKPKKTKVKKEMGAHSKIKTLFLINLKRVIVNKGIIAMACIFIILNVLFTISTSSSISLDTYITLIAQFILQLFFFIIFLTLLVNDLYKKQMIDGIQIIEVRSGIKITNSFFMRYLIYLTIAFSLCTLNMLISVALRNKSLFETSISASIYWSTYFFFFIFTLIWAPIIIAINVSVSVAGSVVLNIFLGTVVIFSQLISGVVLQTTQYDYFTSANLTTNPIWTARVELSYSFYDEFKNDDKISKWFNDSFFAKVNNNLNYFYVEDEEGAPEPENNSSLNLKNNFKFNYKTWKSSQEYNYNNNGGHSSSANPYEQLLSQMLYGYKLNYALDYNGNKPVHVLENTNIYSFLSEVYNLIDTNFLDSSKKAPHNNAAEPVFWDTTNGNVIKLSPLIEWLDKQESMKDYKSYLEWLDKNYDKYIYSIMSTRVSDYNSSDYYTPFQLIYNNSGTSNPSIDWNRFIPLNPKTQEKTTEYNNNVNKIYNRYPELLLFNWFVLSNFSNSVRIDSAKNSNSKSLDAFLSAADSIGGSSSNYLTFNPFTHFSTMYFNSFSSPVTNDLFSSIYNVAMWQGSRKPIVNLKSLAKYDSENRKDDEISPIYEEYKPERNATFSVTGAYVFYLLFSALITYFSFLIFKRFSRI
ncbi:hypothetical protein SLITO_v1c00960 [Spiroplasma litorale]|uniref:Uncharacterized protein n=1 Tax=Spiroplasma litorale TaxID=216942 RepID=A0A0K1W0E3_9MOLU|nr:hypothetical protein [Spiroplasma litorale]AKX33764.1 hypothetical protein SLITO_v1c00960 [Spiroplasma litorale]